jgi:hypothetical protein
MEAQAPQAPQETPNKKMTRMEKIRSDPVLYEKYREQQKRSMEKRKRRDDRGKEDVELIDIAMLSDGNYSYDFQSDVMAMPEVSPRKRGRPRKQPLPVEYAAVQDTAISAEPAVENSGVPTTVHEQPVANGEPAPVPSASTSHASEVQAFDLPEIKIPGRLSEADRQLLKTLDADEKDVLKASSSNPVIAENFIMNKLKRVWDGDQGAAAPYTNNIHDRSELVSLSANLHDQVQQMKEWDREARQKQEDCLDFLQATKEQRALFNQVRMARAPSLAAIEQQSLFYKLMHQTVVQKLEFARCNSDTNSLHWHSLLGKFVKSQEQDE